ncbi:hypothetical protein BH10PSE2_BH10PSE2_20620 [soil metagenome]
MIGIVLDTILMLLLVAALGYGVRLEKKLTALRAGQLAFAGAVTELNTAAGRAENALQSLRASGEEADMLHDRIIKARAVKQELEMLIARAPRSPSLEVGKDDRASDQGGDVSTPRIASNSPARAAVALQPSLPTRGREAAVIAPDDERATRMAALAERIHGLAAPARIAVAPGRESVSAILGALTANQSAQQSLNRARRSLDEDLFAA